MEPPGSHLRRRPAPGEEALTEGHGEAAAERAPTAVVFRRVAVSREDLRLGAGAGAAALALSSSGEVVLLAVLLGAAAGDVIAGVVAMLATGAVALRWGTTSLEAIAGAQSVLGPAVAVGPVAAAVSTWCAAASLVLARAPGLAAPLFGVAAGLIVAGPGAGSLRLVLMRAVVAVLGAALAVGAGRWLPATPRPLAVALAAGAVVLAVLA